MPSERIAEFLTDPESDSFDEIALATLANAYETDAKVRETCDRRGLRPGEIEDWRSIPTVPAGGPTDREAQPVDDLAAATSFHGSCLQGLAAPPILDLVADERSAALRERFGGPGSIAPAGSERIDVNAARSWLAGRQRDGRAAVVLASEPSMRRLLGTLERQDLRFRMGFGSRVVLMGEPTATEERPLETLAVERLALAAEAIFREYRRPGIATACYGRAESDGSLVISAPHWMRFAAVDPLDGADREEGAEGRLVVLDLTSAASPFRVETPDLGAVENSSVRITGGLPPESAP